MPTYVYECAACKNRFEERQSILADKLVDCPRCKLPKLERLISTGVGVVWKGGAPTERFWGKK